MELENALNYKKKIKMKKIFVPLLFIISSIVAGQTTLATKLKILSNSTSTTATKVNVQEANGEVNTIAKADLIDYLEYTSTAAFPVPGAIGKLYLTKDTNKLYRWNGVIYTLVADVTLAPPSTTIIDGNTSTSPNEDVVYDALQGKLDKEAYSGTATILDSRISVLETLQDVKNNFTGQAYAIWTGSGLVYDVIYPSYYIDGVLYPAGSSQITLNASDTSFSRIDIIAVDSTGAIKISGLPEENPLLPTFDPLTQLQITTVLINANAIIPTDSSFVSIYKENVEWVGTSSFTDIDYASTTSAFQDNYGVRVGAIASTPTFKSLIFTGSTLYSPGSWNLLTLRLKLNGSFSSNRFDISLRNNNTQVSSTVSLSNNNYGYTTSPSGQWLYITIPFSAMHVTGAFNTLAISLKGGNAYGFSLDNIVFSLGNNSITPLSNSISTINTNNGVLVSNSPEDTISILGSGGAVVSASGKTITVTAPTQVNQVSQSITNGITAKAPSEDVVYDTLQTKENVSNKDSGALSNSSSTYPTSSVVKAAVDLKIDKNTPITGATSTKVTYDSKGLITSGTILSAGDIPNIDQSQVNGLSYKLSLKAPLSSLTNTQNYVVKYGPTGQLPSRIVDTGTYLGIGTVHEPTKDLTFGNQVDREIGIEVSDNLNTGKGLRIGAGKAINYSLSNTFVPVIPTGNNAKTLSRTNSGDIYATRHEGPNRIMYAGTSVFVETLIITPLYANSRNSAAFSPDNSHYICIENVLHKRTGNIGDYVSLGETASQVAINRITGDIYIIKPNDGVYKQTAGSGSFVSQGVPSQAFSGIAIAPDGTVYVSTATAIIKQPLGSGSFITHASGYYFALLVTNNNNLYAIVYPDSNSNSIVSQINCSGAFSVVAGSNVDFYNASLIDDILGNVYAGSMAKALYVQNNQTVGTANLDGGNLILSSGTGKGTGSSNQDFYTGQKTTSGTDMQIETLRMRINNEGLMTLPSTTNEVIEADLSGKAVPTVEYMNSRIADVVGGSSSETNLSFTPSSTNGTVTSDTGTDAVIPLADVTNAGLIAPAEKLNISTALQPGDNISELSNDSNYLTTADNYWTKTGDNIQNNNIGNTKIKIQPYKQVQFLNSAGTQVGFIDDNGTYRAGTGSQYVTVGLLGGNTWMSMVRSQASMGVILGNPQVSQPFITTSTNYFGSSYVAGSNEVAEVANAEHSFNIGNASGDGITSGIFRIGRTRLQSTVPVKYAIDLSASFDDRTLVDKGFVNNGLTAKANDADVLHKTGDETKAGGLVVTKVGSWGIPTLSGNSANGIGVKGYSSTAIGITAESNTGTGLWSTSESGTAVNAQSVSGVGVYAESNSGISLIVSVPSTNTSNIAEFKKDGISKTVIQNDGKITATAGTASNDVVVKSQLDAVASGIPGELGYTPENSANKSDSYITPSSTTYVSTKALVDGLATKQAVGSYLTSYTETDPTVKAITGLVKSNGTIISSAVAGTDYLTPTGSAAGLTSFPTLNQNTTGNALSITGTITQSQVTSLVSDLALKAPLSSLTNTQNYLVKYGLTGQTTSRIFDSGTYLGIGTSSTPTKDLTFGNQSDKEIGIEESNNTTSGKSLVLRASRTINYVSNNVFTSLNQPFDWVDIKTHPDGTVYMISNSSGLYKKSTISDEFILVAANGMGYLPRLSITPDGTMYLGNTDGVSVVRVSTNNGVTFTAIPSETLFNVVSMCSTSSGNTYAVKSNGALYRRTGNSGTFQLQAEPYRGGFLLAYGNDVYLFTSSTVYKQTNESGGFVDLNQTSRNYTGAFYSIGGDIYGTVGTTVYKQTGGTGNFNLDSSFTAIGGATATVPNGDWYSINISSTNVYKKQNNGAGTANLDGGTLKHFSGTGKGTGGSNQDFYTGQKTVSGTDMQIETLRMRINNEGLVTLPSTTTAIIDADTTGKSVPTKEWVVDKIATGSGTFTESDPLAIRLTGDQSVAGKKTFSSLVTLGNPTLDSTTKLKVNGNIDIIVEDINGGIPASVNFKDYSGNIKSSIFGDNDGYLTLHSTNSMTFDSSDTMNITSSGGVGLSSSSSDVTISGTSGVFITGEGTSLNINGTGVGISDNLSVSGALDSNSILTNNIVASDIEANSIKVVGGLSSQFLKADGTRDSNTYLTAASISGKEDTSNKSSSYTTTSTTTYPDTKALVDGLATKQSTLISGSNIRTINGNSLLGSADLVVSAVESNSDILSKQVLTTTDLTTSTGFINTEDGVQGGPIGTENFTVMFPTIDYTRKFRIDIVFKVKNASTVNARIEVKKSGNSYLGLSYVEMGGSTLAMNKTHLNSQGISDLPSMSTFQYSIIGNTKRVVRNVIPISSKWDGTYSTTYLPSFTGQIISQSEPYNYNPSGSLEMFKDINEISVTGTNTNEIIVESINVQYFDDPTIYKHKKYLATLMDLSILNDSKDDSYPSYLYCPPNSKALVQWHHPNGYNGTIEGAAYGKFFPDLYNDGYAICFGTFNSFNTPAGTSLWGAGVTSSNWGAPAGLVYRKALNDYVDSLINADYFIEIGGSMGGFNALSYAARYPNKVRYVVSVSGALDLTYNYNNGFTGLINKAYGSSYRCIAASTGNSTSNSTYWVKIASDKDAPSISEYSNPFYDIYSGSKSYAIGDVVFENYTGNAAGLSQFDFKLNPESLTKVPLLFIHGTSDLTIDDIQSIDIKNAINSAGGNVTLKLVEGADHLALSLFEYSNVRGFLNGSEASLALKADKLSISPNATDVNFTAKVNSITYLPSSVLTTDKTITIPAGSSGDLLEFYNNESGFTWLLSGSPVYLSDGATTVSTLTANTNYLIRYVAGKWRILN